MNPTSHHNVDRDDQSCKFWLQPVALARNLRFSARELRNIEKIIIENERLLLEAWNDYF